MTARARRVLRNAGADEIARAYDALGTVPLILEGFVDFCAEISVIAARGRDGGPPPTTRPRTCTATASCGARPCPPRVSADIAERAQAAACAVLDALDYVGVIGVEFFVTGDGELLANEIAPRVHNSGHWTEAACAVSQFEQHIRAIAGLPLGATGATATASWKT